jgi:hypothetical protein
LLAIAWLEISFIVLLLSMLSLAGLLGLVVVVRLVEPRGLKYLMRRGFERSEFSKLFR